MNLHLAGKTEMNRFALNNLSNDLQNDKTESKFVGDGAQRDFMSGKPDYLPRTVTCTGSAVIVGSLLHAFKLFEHGGSGGSPCTFVSTDMLLD